MIEKGDHKHESKEKHTSDVHLANAAVIRSLTEEGDRITCSKTQVAGYYKCVKYVPCSDLNNRFIIPEQFNVSCLKHYIT